MAHRIVVLFAALCLITPGAIVGPSAAARAAVRADDGAHVTSAAYRNARTVDLTIASPALAGTGHARVLLPPDYRRSPGRRWPVLYLLHGCCGTAGWKDWTTGTDVAAFSAHTDVMIVMPEGGTFGYYTNWWNHGRYGAPAWETFHLTELRQLLERGWRAGTRRAIAGLSMGGFGALSYTARHRGMFAAAASFSGLDDTDMYGVYALGVEGFMISYGYDPHALWGDPVLQHRVWAAHNPYDLMGKLRGVPLFIAAGDGRPGPLDPKGSAPDVAEGVMGPQSVKFVAKARRMGLNMRTYLYGPGSHTAPYFQRDLHHAWPMLTGAIGAGRAVT